MDNCTLNNIVYNSFINISALSSQEHFLNMDNKNLNDEYQKNVRESEIFKRLDELERKVRHLEAVLQFRTSKQK